MLLPTMNRNELIKEIALDYLKIFQTTLKRLEVEYDRERRRNRISKTAIYQRIYEIKTHRKNNWILLISKDPSVDNYNGVPTMVTGFFTYYYTEKGLRVFKINGDGQIVIYNGHVFKRYNERMNLGLVKTIDIIKKFFLNNGHSAGSVIKKNGKEIITISCQDGLIFGEVQDKWIILKTFITRDLCREEQSEMEAEILLELMKEAEDADKMARKSSHIKAIVKTLCE